MKLSKSSTIHTLFTLILFVAVLFAPQARVEAAFTTVDQLDIDLQTLKTKLGLIQQLGGQIPALQGIQPQVSEALANIEGISGGLGSIGQVLNIPVLSQIPGVTGAGGIDAGLEGFSAILNTPLFSNFEGSSGIKQTLSKVTNAADGLTRIGNFLDIPEIKSIDSLVNFIQGGGTSAIGGGFAGGSFGGSGITGVSSQAQAAAKIAGALTGFNQETGSGNAFSSAITAVGTTLVGEKFEQLLGTTKKVPTTAAGLDVAAACQVSAPAGGAGGLVESAGAAVTQSAFSRLTSQATNFLTQAASPITNLFGGGSIGSDIISGISSTGKGVPVVEQDGPLLKVVQESRSLSQLACQHLAMIRYIQEELNPKAREAAEARIQQSVIDRENFENQGRNSILKGAPQQSFFVDRQAYVDESTKAARAVAITKVEESLKAGNSRYAPEILRQIRRDGAIEEDAGQKILAQLQPAPTTDSEDPGVRFMTAIHPKNNVFAQHMTAQNLVNQYVADAKVNAGQTWDAGGGVAPQITCPPGVAYIKTDRGEICEKPTVVLPGSVIGNVSSEYKTTGLRQNENADKFQENLVADKSLRQQEENLANVSTASEGRTYGISDIFGVIDIVCDISPNLDLCKQANKASSILDTISQITGANIGGAVSRGGPTSVEIGASLPTPSSAPLGPDTSTVSWQAANADQCVAANDWISYTDNGNITLIPKTVVSRGSPLATSGSLAIARPALFKVLASADGTPQQQNLRTTFRGNHQDTVFTPNVTGLYQGSRFQITINNKTIVTRVPLSGFTREAVVADLKSARSSLSPGSAAEAEFNKYSFSGDSSLLISAPLPFSFPTSGEYAISCSGPGGEASDSVNLSF